MDLRETEQIVMKIIRQAGQLTIENINNFKVDKRHDAVDITGNIDLEVEKMVVSAIKEQFPEHNIISEEMGDLGKESEHTWYLDPIDGTKYYAKGIPLFTVSIALMHNQEFILGIIYDPNADKMYRACKGNGAFVNDKPLKVSENCDLSKSIITLDIVRIHDQPLDKIDEQLKILNNILLKTYRTRAMGNGSLSMCYLAQGYFDAYYDLTGKEDILDLAAGVVIVREAGGYASDIDGNPIETSQGHFIVTNGEITDRFAELIKNS